MTRDQALERHERRLALAAQVLTRYQYEVHRSAYVPDLWVLLDTASTTSYTVDAAALVATAHGYEPRFDEEL